MAQGPVAAMQGAGAAPSRAEVDVPRLPPLANRGATSRDTIEMDLAAYADSLDGLRPALESVRAALDRTQFEVTDLNASLDFDPGRISQFVRANVAFEQYVGVLRGARGTLIARAGNALDQSLLLGALLDEAVYDWRIVKARLTAQQAESLVAQMAKAGRGDVTIGERQPLVAAMRAVLSANGIDDGEIQTAADAVREIAATDFFSQQTQADAEFIVQALEDAGVSTSAEPMAEIVAEARDYYFVEYRIDAFRPWEAVHPAAGGMNDPDVERLETFTRVDDSLRHRVQVRAFVEQKIDDELFVHEVLETPSYATADLVGRPLTMALQPSGLTLDTASDIDRIIEETSVFVTTLQGTPVGKAFDLDGRVYDVSVLGLDHYGFTELLQAGAAQAEQGIAAISGLGDASEAATVADDHITLTGHWIEYTVLTPGGEATSHRRYVFDRIGPDNRAAGRAEITSPLPIEEAAKALFRSSTVMTLTGKDNMAHALDRMTERMLGALDLIEAALRDPDTIPRSELLELAPIEDAVLGLAAESGQALARDVLSYRDAPMLAVYEQGVIPGRSELTSFERVDVVSASRRTFSVADSGLEPSFADTVRAGVWETIAESAPLQHDRSRAFGTMSSLRAAQAEGIPISVFTAADEDTIRGSEHSEQTKVDLLAATAAGRVVVAPARPPDGADAVGWWEVDPATGQTLGVATGGYGLSEVEYLGILLTIGFTAIGAYSCIDRGGGTACCIVMTSLVAGAAFVAAAMLGALVVYFFVGATDVGIGVAGIGLFGGLKIDAFTFPLVSCPAG